MPPKGSKKGSSKKNTPPSPSSPSFRVRKAQREAPSLGSDMTIVHVGSTSQRRETFMVHKNLLMTTSGFFAMGLSSDFLESHEGVFEMVEEDSDIFSVFVQWLYFGRLFVKTNAGISAGDEDEEWSQLPRLYTLGERLDAPRFKDAVVTAIIEKVVETEIIPDNWVSYVYSSTVSACALRRLIVDFHVFANRGELLKRGASPDIEDGCLVFMQDAIDRLVDAGKQVHEGGELPWVVDACAYHEHGESRCALNEDGDGEVIG